MPPLASPRGSISPEPRAHPSTSPLGRGGGPLSRGRGLYDSVDPASHSPLRPQPPATPSPPFFSDHSPHGTFSGLGHRAAAPTSAGPGVAYGGLGSLAGPGDPYERPSRSGLLGARSRLRQDRSSGALEAVSGRYRALFAGHHTVRKGLRRSIADAYAAYVGQVVALPHDAYGSALRALDATFNPGGTSLPGALDGRLGTSPHATVAAKRAAVFHAACSIMRDLDGYVYDVAYYCPGELDALRGTRGRSAGGGGGSSRGAAAAGGEAGRTGGAGRGVAEARAAGATSSPWPGQQTSGSKAPAPSRAASRTAPPPERPRAARPGGPPTEVNPVTGALRPRPPTVGQDGYGAYGHGTDVKAHAGGHARGSLDASPPASSRRPASAPPQRRLAAVDEEGSGREGAAAEEGGGGRRRRGGPGYVAAPPHYRVARYYHHTSPTQEVLMYLRSRAHHAEQSGAAPEGAAGGERGGQAASVSAAAHAAAARDDAAAIAAVEQALSLGGAATRSQAPPSAGVMQRPAGAGASHRPGRRLSDGPHHGPQPHGHHYLTDQYSPEKGTERNRSASGMREGASSRGHPAAAPAPAADAGVSDPWVAHTDRVLRILETADELTLAEALGLQGPLGPPPYPRSHRMSPSHPYRRQYYEGLYGGPGRHGVERTEQAGAEAGGAAGAAHWRDADPEEGSPPAASRQQHTVSQGAEDPQPRPGPATGHGTVHSGAQAPLPYGGSASGLQAADAAWHPARAAGWQQQQQPPSPGQRYNRSMRLSP